MVERFDQGSGGSRPSKASIASTSRRFLQANKTLVLELARSEYGDPPRKRDRSRQQRNRQDAHRSRDRSRGLSERAIGRVPIRPRPLSMNCWRLATERLLRLQQQVAGYKILIVDELDMSSLADRGRAAIRDIQPAPASAVQPSKIEPAVRRMDQRVRVRASDRRAARSPHHSCPYPGNERR